MTHEEILAKLQTLTTLELNLVDHLLTNKDYAEIAQQMGNSELTIRNRASRIFHKFGIIESNGVTKRHRFVLSLFTPRDLTAVKMRLEEARRLPPRVQAI